MNYNFDITFTKLNNLYNALIWRGLGGPLDKFVLDNKSFSKFKMS